MRLSRIGRLVSGLVLVAMVAACGGGSSGPGSDPVTSVKGALNAMSSGSLTSLGDYACAAQKDNLASMLGGGGALDALPSGAGDLLGSMKVTYDNLDVQQKSVSGDTATVHVKGNLKVSFDDAKLKEFVKQMLAASGQTVDDATLNLALNAIKTQLSGSGTAMDQDITLKNEGGKWLICQ